MDRLASRAGDPSADRRRSIGSRSRSRHPVYAERYQQTKRRLGKQRGPKIAKLELARKLAEAIWHMLTRNQPFAPASARTRLAA